MKNVFLFQAEKHFLPYKLSGYSLRGYLLIFTSQETFLSFLAETARQKSYGLIIYALF